MKVFAYSYDDGDNLIESFELGVFGAPDDGTGLGSKVRQLEIGDLLLIRVTDRGIDDEGTLRFAPLCRIVGRVFDQRVESPFRDYLWPDEVRISAVLYPFRCAIQRLGAVRQNIMWADLDSLGFKNQKGKPLCGRRMWAAKLRGNVFTQDEARSLSGLLLGSPAAQ